MYCKARWFVLSPFGHIMTRVGIATQLAPAQSLSSSPHFTSPVTWVLLGVLVSFPLLCCLTDVLDSICVLFWLCLCLFCIACLLSVRWTDFFQPLGRRLSTPPHRPLSFSLSQTVWFSKSTCCQYSVLILWYSVCCGELGKICSTSHLNHTHIASNPQITTAVNFTWPTWPYSFSNRVTHGLCLLQHHHTDDMLWWHHWVRTSANASASPPQNVSHTHHFAGPQMSSEHPVLGAGGSVLLFGVAKES